MCKQMKSMHCVVQYNCDTCAQEKYVSDLCSLSTYLL